MINNGSWRSSLTSDDQSWSRMLSHGKPWSCCSCHSCNHSYYPKTSIIRNRNKHKTTNIWTNKISSSLLLYQQLPCFIILGLAAYHAGPQASTNLSWTMKNCNQHSWLSGLPCTKGLHPLPIQGCTNHPPAQLPASPRMVPAWPGSPCTSRALIWRRGGMRQGCRTNCCSNQRLTNR